MEFRQGLAALQGAMERSGDFSLTAEQGGFLARRRRIIPSRRLFRMLFPCAKVTATSVNGTVRVSIRPDGWAWFMVVMCLGGLVVELTMDRARYPREYPPAFVYGLTLFIIANLVIEVRRTRDAVQRAVATTR